jgi:peptide/nickel transport system substrate-binding protein
VDTEGNQLPYIDGIEQQLLQDAESCLLKALAGEIDFQYREVVGLDNYSVHMKNKDKSNYRLIPALTPRPNIYSIFTNHNSEDPVKRALYNDIRFRRALSLAINREEINQLLLKGMSEPSQASPPPGSESYVREVAKMYTEFDLDRANELLDEVGLEWDNNRQWRLGPDGNRLQFVKIFYVSWPNGQAEAQDLIKQTWAQIGIDVVNKPIERSLWTQQMLAGEYDMSAYSAGGGASGPYLPLASNRVFPTNDYWFPEPDWGSWFQNGGQSGEEPPADAKRSYELYKEYTTTATSERMVEIEKEAYRLFVDNLWAIGVLVRPEREVYYVTHNRYRNVPDEVVDDVTYWHPASFFIEQ